MAAELINPRITLGPQGQPSIAVSYALPLQAQQKMLDAVNIAFEGQKIKRGARADFERKMSEVAQVALLGLESVGALAYDPIADEFRWVGL